MNLNMLHVNEFLEEMKKHNNYLKSDYQIIGHLNGSIVLKKENENDYFPEILLDTYNADEVITVLKEEEAFKQY